MTGRVTPEGLDELCGLAMLLWPDNDERALREELSAILGKEDAACFIERHDQRAVGFAQCQLRRDYVEGTDTSPVGYLEGVYVRPEYRGLGVARALLARCEQWAREQGCTEFASDCELGNEGSLRFHLASGFEEVNRVICFRKAL